MFTKPATDIRTFALDFSAELDEGVIISSIAEADVLTSGGMAPQTFDPTGVTAVEVALVTASATNRTVFQLSTPPQGVTLWINEAGGVSATTLDDQGATVPMLVQSGVKSGGKKVSLKIRGGTVGAPYTVKARIIDSNGDDKTLTEILLIT